MIARVSGIIIISTDRYLVIENNGIAYRVFVTSETLLHQGVGQLITLWTSHIIREDTQDLYGFETIQDQELFELLLSVSGIGPRSALGVMNVATLGTIARAIHTNDVSYLTKVSGIGKKTAEKIIIELRDKLPQHESISEDSSSRDVIDALIALGYLEPQAREVVRSLDSELTTQIKIKEALKLLGKVF